MKNKIFTEFIFKKYIKKIIFILSSRDISHSSPPHRPSKRFEYYFLYS
jgi:hypothetical protein